MTININDIIANLPPERKARVEKRAAELITEETTLQDLQKAKIIPGEDIEVRAIKMQSAAQMQVTKDIDLLKAMGEPIYYQNGKQLIKEESDGRKFEYRLREDGSEEILGKLS
ncbi:hypothetical protein [Chamaesiphon polymorphus]|uniref:Uncharacterized protein n=1 Tax=Chamaesiphon polymorphus CCALA 037 TaxID=2107692 RepID=A0A2T1FBR1_9CYAN|nr:hypothetical protein [Chamaesiphon polymorphus]PSB42415.1 hypothetical protein C7B77_26725 [Chamaesiphon polymorphus CCALA 037]